MYAVELLEYDCVTCTAHQKISRGCDQDSPKEHLLVLNGEEHVRCPRRPILDDPGHYSEVFWNFQQKDKGFLPDGGAMNDQANYMIQAFRVIDDTLGSIERHKKEREKSKSRRQATKNMARGGRGKKPRRR